MATGSTTQRFRSLERGQHSQHDECLVVQARGQDVVTHMKLWARTQVLRSGLSSGRCSDQWPNAKPSKQVAGSATQARLRLACSQPGSRASRRASGRVPRRLASWLAGSQAARRWHTDVSTSLVELLVLAERCVALRMLRSPVQSRITGTPHTPAEPEICHDGSRPQTVVYAHAIPACVHICVRARVRP